MVVIDRCIRNQSAQKTGDGLMQRPAVLGIITYPVFPAEMGGQKCATAFYATLARHTRVVLAVSKENQPADIFIPDTYPFLYHHRKGWANLRWIFRLRKMIRQQGIDIICVDHSYPAVLGWILKKLTGKKLVIRSHNIESHRFRDMRRFWWRLYQVYEKWIHRRADHSFFITPEDQEWAISHWQLSTGKCSVVPYGTSRTVPATEEERLTTRKQFLQTHQLSADTRLFLFNGTLDYIPNTDALWVLVYEIIPRLRKTGIPFRMLITGKRIRKDWEKVFRSTSEILFLGFVPDVDAVYLTADAFVNPVTLGSGIKTKLVDAVAAGTVSITTESGARGIAPELAGEDMIRIPDYDWNLFAATMASLPLNAGTHTPPAFYMHFHWEAIIKNALLSLQSL
jgi:glycosyltransferase involved in cell wall biosynthesis